MTIHIALVGAPSTGKTTLANELGNRGHCVIHEVSRELILEQKEIGGKILPNIDRGAFQKEILKRQIARREAVKDEKIVFSDTSIACGIAFYLVDNVNPPKELWQKAKEFYYDKVFFLEFLPFYEEDGLRIEDEKKSREIHNKLKEVHEKLGHEIISVPFM